MQKLAKRAAQAQRTAAKQRLKLTKYELRREHLQYQEAFGKAAKDIKQNVYDMWRDRRDAWEKGPLAPKQDLPFNTYGMAHEDLRDTSGNSHPETMFQQDFVAKRVAWAGTVNQLCLAPGDRVVIMAGHYKGKVDTIKSVDKRNGTVVLEKYMKSIRPGAISVAESSTGKGHEFDNPISISDIRLVYPITNPDTGVTKDAIISELRPIAPNMQSVNMTFERWEHGIKYDRLVPALNMTIPWPAATVPEVTTHEGDTARDEVDNRTFFYNLLTPPMPDQILNELRNPYSRFRTRHEAWYIEKKEAEDAAKKGRANMLKSMQTPEDELSEKRRKAKAERGEPELTDEMLAKIGEVMIKSQQGASQKASPVEEQPPSSS